MRFAHYLPRTLKKSGDNWRGECPYCGSSDGFSISLTHREGGAFHCFSCREKGTAVWYLQEIHNVDFPTACEACGTTPEEITDGEITQTARRTRKKTYRQQKAESLARLKEYARLQEIMTEREHARWMQLGALPPERGGKELLAKFERKIIHSTRDDYERATTEE